MVLMTAILPFLEKRGKRGDWKAVIRVKGFYSERRIIWMQPLFHSRATNQLNRIVIKLVLIQLNADFYVLKIPRELLISM